MSDLILHHYAGSPFSEKVRLIFGYKRMAWQSVVVPVMLPKPDVMALTGGYRRTPFMQIGADIYCDSALMCRVIERHQPEPTLYPSAISGMADIVAEWADSTLFWTAVPYTMQPIGIAQIFAGGSPEFLKAFGADRAAMSPNRRRATVVDGSVQVQAYLARLEQMLSGGNPFLLGPLPCIADFAAVQSIWFIRRAPSVAVILDRFTRVAAWFERMAAFGHGRPIELTSEAAIAIAARAVERDATSITPGQGFSHGDAVTVTPTDYAHDSVAGRLVGLDDDEVVLQRDDERAGTLQVHFPRIGFQVRIQQPSV